MQHDGVMMLKWLDAGVRKGVVRVLCLFCVVFAVYGNTFSLPFVYDDGANILENKSIQSFSPLWRPLVTEPGKGLSGRPVAALSFALNYAAGGTATWGYHLVNILIHAAVAVVLCNLILLAFAERRLGGRYDHAAPWLAFLVALFWCVHPLTTQAVTYISQRLESQAALFFLLCMYCALKGQDAKKPLPWHILALGAYVLGAGAKESVGVAPVLVWAYDCVVRGKRPLAALAESKVLYGGLAVLMVLHGLYIFHGGQLDAGVHVAKIPWHIYMFTQGEVILHYFRLVFWPYPLVLDYAWPAASFLQGIGPFSFMLGLTCATFYWALRRKAWSYPLLWILLTLAPTCIAPMVDPAVEYRMYVPLMGVLFFVVLAGYHGLVRLNKHVRSGRLPVVGIVLCVLFAGVLGCVSARRNTDYRDSLAIWQDTINKRPGNPRGYLNYGVTLQNSGQYEEAFDYFLRTIEIEPESTKAYLYAGISLLKLERPKDALPFLRQAQSSTTPNERARAHESMAQAYVKMGRVQPAVKELRKAIDLEPGSARRHFLLGRIFYNNGDTRPALENFCRAGMLSGHWRRVAPYLGKLAPESNDPCVGQK